MGGGGAGVALPLGVPRTRICAVRLGAAPRGRPLGVYVRSGACVKPREAPTYELCGALPGGVAARLGGSPTCWLFRSAVHAGTYDCSQQVEHRLAQRVALVALTMLRRPSHSLPTPPRAGLSRCGASSWGPASATGRGWGWCTPWHRSQCCPAPRWAAQTLPCPQNRRRTQYQRSSTSNMKHPVPGIDIHNPQSTIHNPQSTIHYPLSTIYNPQSTIHYPQFIIHYPLSTIHYPLSSTSIQCPVPCLPSVQMPNAS